MIASEDDLEIMQTVPCKHFKTIMVIYVYIPSRTPAVFTLVTIIKLQTSVFLINVNNFRLY